MQLAHFWEHSTRHHISSSVILQTSGSSRDWQTKTGHENDPKERPGPGVVNSSLGEQTWQGRSKQHSLNESTDPWLLTAMTWLRLVTYYIVALF
jgi:hypothetical protein